MASSLRAKDLAHIVLYKVEKGEELKDVLKRVEAYLEKMNRLDLFPLTLKYAKTLYEQASSKDAVCIVSSCEIKAGVVKDIVHTFSMNKIAHMEGIDEDMIGGFEAVYKDRKVGVNLKTNIESLRKHIIS